MHAALDRVERQLPMQMRGSRDGQGIDIQCKQLVDMIECFAAKKPGNESTLVPIGIGNPDEFHSGNIGKYPGMVAAHHPHAHHTHARRFMGELARRLRHYTDTPCRLARCPA